jgi:hypothetical protein
LAGGRSSWQEQEAGTGGRSRRLGKVTYLVTSQRKENTMFTSRGFRDLKVYKLAFRLAMEIFEESKRFPREENFR